MLVFAIVFSSIILNVCSYFFKGASKRVGSERCYFVFRSSSPEHISCFGISRICYCYCDSCVSFPMSTTFLRSRVSRLQFCLHVFPTFFSFLHGMSIVRGGVQITSGKVIYQLPISMLNSVFACNGNAFRTSSRKFRCCTSSRKRPLIQPRADHSRRRQRQGPL